MEQKKQVNNVKKEKNVEIRKQIQGRKWSRREDRREKKENML